DPLGVLLRQFKSDLVHLIESGIDVRIDGVNEKIYPTISTIIADNLGMYELLGMKMSFQNTAFVCRFCGGNGKSKDNGTFSIQDDLEEFPVLANDEDLTLQQRIDLTTDRQFIFDGIDGISRWNIAPCDIFHDLPEGVLQDALE